MNTRLLPLLRDPNDQAPLELHAFAAEPGFTSAQAAPSGPSVDFTASRVREGVLVQPQTGRWYPIEDGLPSLFADALRVGGQREREAAFAHRHRSLFRELGLSSDEGSSSSQGSSQGSAHGSGNSNGSGSSDDFARIDSERAARDEQAEAYDAMPALRALELFERPAYTRAIENALGGALPGAQGSLPLLEAGCGTGRHTGFFAQACDELVAVDMSRDSIERNRVRHAGRTRATIHFVHADLTHLPLRSASFCATAHCGVYEHIPSRELRQQFLEHARRTLSPGGTLLLSAYRYAGLARLFEKQGEHAGGIPFVRFTQAELRAEVEPFFEIKAFRENLAIYMSMLTAAPRAQA